MSEEPVSPELDPGLAQPAAAEEEEGLVVACATHPNVQTALRCGRCDTPICPKCLAMASTSPGATIITMPMPMLNTRNISSR